MQPRRRRTIANTAGGHWSMATIIPGAVGGMDDGKFNKSLTWIVPRECVSKSPVTLDNVSGTDRCSFVSRLNVRDIPPRNKSTRLMGDVDMKQLTKEMNNSGDYRIGRLDYLESTARVTLLLGYYQIIQYFEAGKSLDTNESLKMASHPTHSSPTGPRNRTARKSATPMYSRLDECRIRYPKASLAMRSRPLIFWPRPVAAMLDCVRRTLFNGQAIGDTHTPGLLVGTVLEAVMFGTAWIALRVGVARHERPNRSLGRSAVPPAAM
ncbi:hypothetical protein DFH09DRAFT_1076314 [Mycena vulgaris]|nr:hypothetical protein DFH09DRAFT_1076314 [Mycena vulgaris]